VTLDEARANIGASVAYHPRGADPEDGVIAGVTAHFVFVRHRGDHNGAKASSPEDITLITGGAPLPAQAAGPVRRAAEQERGTAADVPAVEAAPVQGVLFGEPSAVSAAMVTGRADPG
jgi:hypothetical protein